MPIKIIVVHIERFGTVLFFSIPTGTLPSPANYLCYSGQSVAGVTLMVQQGIANPQLCINRCKTTLGCTLAVFDYMGQCTLSQYAFIGGQGSTARDASVVEMCLASPGAPDTSEPLVGPANQSMRPPLLS